MGCHFRVVGKNNSEDIALTNRLDVGMIKANNARDFLK